MDFAAGRKKFDVSAFTHRYVFPGDHTPVVLPELFAAGRPLQARGHAGRLDRMQEARLVGAIMSAAIAGGPITAVPLVLPELAQIFVDLETDAAVLCERNLAERNAQRKLKQRDRNCRQPC